MKWSTRTLRYGLLAAATLLVSTQLACSDSDNPAVALRVLASLSGEQEFPGVLTNARGLVDMLLIGVHLGHGRDFEGAATSIDVTASTTGLSNVTQAHVHVGAPGTNGPPIFSLYNAQTDGALPTSLTRTLLPGDLIPRPAQGIETFQDAADAIANGMTYVNFHTSDNPDGEVRGQLGAVTETFDLTAQQEVEQPASTATGSATVAFNALQNAFTVQLATTGIGAATAAHIHVGQPGENGPVVVTLFSGTSMPNPLTVTVDADDLTAQPDQAIEDFTDLVNAMLAGRTYLNVHTEAFPAGELRGQIFARP